MVEMHPMTISSVLQLKWMCMKLPWKMMEVFLVMVRLRIQFYLYIFGYCFLFFFLNLNILCIVLDSVHICETSFMFVTDVGSRHTSSTPLTVSSSNNRCFAARRSGKRWKRQYYLQQKARQERLNNSRKWKGVDCDKVLTLKADENVKCSDLDFLASETSAEVASDIVGVDNDDNKVTVSGEVESENLLDGAEDNEIGSKKGFHGENCSCVGQDSVTIRKGGENECCECHVSLASALNGAGQEDEGSSVETLKSVSKAKRHYDRDLDNPKPCKSRKPADDCSNLSCKYNNISICGIEDRLPDGFYDAGRDRPFMSLNNYDQNLHLDSREVILLDRSFNVDIDFDCTFLVSGYIIIWFTDVND
jgi:hypothetical protein